MSRSAIWRRNIWMILTVTSVSFGLGGCAGFKDIDKVFFVVSLGIDAGETQRYHVSLKLAIPSPLEKFGNNESLIVQQESDTIAEAVRIVKSKVDKELNFGHCKGIIIGEKLLEQGDSLSTITDWIVRRRDIQMISWTAVGSPNALEVLKAAPRSERLPSNMIFLFFGQTGTETPYVFSEYLFDFRRRIIERGLDPILPIIETRGEGQLTVNKVMLFNKQKRVLTLAHEETKILTLLSDEVDKTQTTLGEHDHKIILSIQKVTPSLSVEISPAGKPSLVVKVKLDGVVEENQADPLSPVRLKELEQMGKEAVIMRTTHLIHKLQKARVDPLGFGLQYRALYARHDGDWEQWQQQYPDAAIRVESDVHIRSSGYLSE